VASIKKRPNGKWRARYQDRDGTWRARHFDRKVDAEQFLAKTLGDLARGEWVDPKAARTKFGEYVTAWTSAQVQHRPQTREQLEARLNRQLLPRFAEVPLGAIRPSDVRGWVAGLSTELAPATVENSYVWFATIMRAARPIA
jgi:hypothetical protein